ncbi:accessory factor UbiK family protein [Humitalea sp. 24SJ18S-53]|uniref:accessory factor UbiK family protein n=1 Tax=Humitalea sp. 24SJ18S-53 TaxID=3422307 RepID=UPI003D6769A4
MSGTGGKKFFDDLAGMAGGAVSMMAGMRAEAEAMVQAQTEAAIQRLGLVKREELDAAMEVARLAREQAEALEARVAALEARLGVVVPVPGFDGLDDGA